MKNLFFLCPLIAFGVAAAQDDVSDEGWAGSIGLSASSASGNTDTSVIGLSLDAGRDLGRYTHSFKAAANYAESSVDDVKSTTANNWFVQYRLDTQLSDRNTAFARVRYEQDEFSGFDQRAFLGAGVSRIMVEEETRTWQLSAGPGVQYSVIQQPDPVPADFEDTQTEFAFYAGSDFDWKIRENVAFTHDFDVTWTSPNTTLSTEFGLVSQLTDSLASKLGYLVKHETDPPEGREQTDTLLTASLVYGF